MCRSGGKMVIRMMWCLCEFIFGPLRSEEVTGSTDNLLVDCPRHLMYSRAGNS